MQQVVSKRRTLLVGYTTRSSLHMITMINAETTTKSQLTHMAFDCKCPPLVSGRKTMLSTSEDILATLISDPVANATSDRSLQYYEKLVEGMSFEDMWEKLREKVPLSQLQSFQHPDDRIPWPVCHPTLVGPRDSENLAILTHGFLSCPGMWFRIVPLLVDAGFRVMLPTLPGHGRKPRLSDDSSDNSANITDMKWSEGIGNDSFELETSGSALLETIRRKRAVDDLADLPRSSHGYLYFAYVLQKLAGQFKKEHPKGLVVVAGHSLGGAITAKFAMEIPEVVDRVLLLNPMLGLGSNFVKGLSQAWKTLKGGVISKGSACENERGTSSGGTCQFKIAHVEAMSHFAYNVLCCQWGLEAKCKAKNILDSFVLPFDIMNLFGSFINPFGSTPYTVDTGILKDTMCKVYGSIRTDNIRTKFSNMRGFQVVSTRGEWLVDNTQIKQFVDVVRSHRADKAHGYTSKLKADFCYWPSDLSHAYISNRKKDDEPEKWWHPYVEYAVAEFLIRGSHIDIVRRGPTLSYDCLVHAQDVEGKFLAVLPAVEHTGSQAKYWLGGEDIGGAFPVEILFSGEVQKESSFVGSVNWRHIELLRYRDRLLIVTRLKPNDNIRDMFLVARMPVLSETEICVKPSMYLLNEDPPLRKAFDAAINHEKDRKPISLRFCGKLFFDALCVATACLGKAEMA